MKRHRLLVSSVILALANGCVDENPPKVWEGPTTVENEKVIACLERKDTFDQIRYTAISSAYGGPKPTGLYITDEDVRLQFRNSDLDGSSLTVSSNERLSETQLRDLEDCRELLPASLRQ